MPTIETLESPLIEFNSAHPSISMADVRSPSNYTYYPWTLPLEYIPQNAMSSPLAMRSTFDLSFPNLPNSPQVGTMQRLHDGILVNSMSGLRLVMVRENDQLIEMDEHFRIYAISNIALGRDEKVFMSRSTVESFNPLDPYFTRTRDAGALDLVIDVPPAQSALPTDTLSSLLDVALGELGNLTGIDIVDALDDIDDHSEALSEDEPSYLSNFPSSLQNLLTAPSPTSIASTRKPATTKRYAVAGTLPIGIGAAPLPDTKDPDLAYSSANPLVWSKIYVHDTDLCTDRLPLSIAKENQIIVIKRGGCSFSHKLRNIPVYPPDPLSLQLVVIVSFPAQQQPPTKSSSKQERNARAQEEVETSLVQPLLDEVQHTPGGLLRPHPIPLIMVDGGEDTMEKLRQANGVSVRRRYYFKTQGVRIGNLIVL